MENVFIEQIPRYENKYFNCVRSQAFSYLKYTGLPMELLLFNSYESTKSVYDQYINEKLERWQYRTTCMSIPCLAMLNITLNESYFSTFEEAKDLVSEIVQSGNIAIIASDLYYLPHRGNYYQTVHIPHYVMVAGHSAEAGKEHYYILDDNSSAMGDYCLYQYDAQLIGKAFNEASKNVISFDCKGIKETEARVKVMKTFVQWMQQVDDDFALYDRVTDLIEGNEGDFSNQDEAMDQLVNSFTILSGSRYLFASFGAYMKFPNEILLLIQEAAKKIDILKSTFIRAKLMKRIDLAAIRNKCGEIKALELQVKSTIQSQIIDKELNLYDERCS